MKDTSVFATCGTRKLDEKIRTDMKEIVSFLLATQSKEGIRAIILGGGYGRGEGGVLFDKLDESPVNDYDMFVVYNKLSFFGRRRLTAKLRLASKTLSERLGFEVDFAPAKDVEDLRTAPFWLIWYELRHGCYTVWGDTFVSELLPKYSGDKTPEIEALKLLLNRGVGLMLAAEKLGKSDEVEFIRRNSYKSILALGDAYLMLAGKYHYSCIERRSHFNQWGLSYCYDEELVRAYSRAVRHKLDPKEIEEVEGGGQNLYQEAKTHYSRHYFVIFRRYFNRVGKQDSYYSVVQSGFISGKGLLEKVKHMVRDLRPFGLH